MSVSKLTQVRFSPVAAWNNITSGSVSTGAHAPSNSTATLPVDPPTITPQYNTILDQAVRGYVQSDTFGAFQGGSFVEVELAGPVYPEEIGYLASVLFGKEYFTASTTAAPAQHEFVVGVPSDPTAIPALAVHLNDVTQDYTFYPAICRSFTFSFNGADSLLTHSSSLRAATWATATVNPDTGTLPNVDPSTGGPFRGWMAQVSAAGAAWQNVISADITISREDSPLYTLRNSQTPFAWVLGAASMTGTLTIIYRTVADLNKFLNNTQEALLIRFAYGTGTNEKRIDIQADTVTYIDAPATIARGDVFETIQLSFRALFNSGGASKGDNSSKLILWNSKNSAYVV